MSEPSQQSGLNHALNSAARSVRRRIRTAKLRLGYSKRKTLSFRELYELESRQLGDPVDERVVWTAGGHEDSEPWTEFTPKDRFGVALSGGGIRSATFNLGLLQSMGNLGILEHVDYLATVSGGGYIGGFWTAWRARQKSNGSADPRIFSGADAGVEQPQIRHLREFSRFLLPRIGLLETEVWGIVMTVLGGIIPSLVTALSVLGLVWCAWLAIVALLTVHPIPAGALAAAFVLLYMNLTERTWRRAGKSDLSPMDKHAFTYGTAVAVVLTAGLWIRFAPPVARVAPRWADALSSYRASLVPAGVTSGATLGLLLLRIYWMRMFRDQKRIPTVVGFERAVTRMVALSAAVVSAGALWCVVIWVSGHEARWWQPDLRKLATVSGASAGLFAIFKNWLLAPVVETRASSLSRRLLGWLRRLTPKVLAWIALVGMFLLVGIALDRICGTEIALAKWAGGSLVGLGLTAWFFDPARVGLHEFYRTRIARCYLGASNLEPGEGAAANRQVCERPKDDLPLKAIRAKGRGPIHLICVAANDLSGDRLGTLYRGARNAVLSGNGISLGDKTSSLDELKLSSALTASAAAFNSHMGRVSIDLGLAVTFLMSALNLRLGLWVPHPDNKFRKPYLFPGRFYLLELLGISRTNGRHLHLSDGNHFENFGLYELIRRHCRYIIVSDCGADPDVAFDDLANVIRRVREDFGVEIEVDVAPLRPGENRNARQHAVVGEIHYDGLSGLDKGSLIYIKPGLTGDEPPDVLQYRTRAPQFPHQTTEDQFYDEPQWESHRRLGEHVGRMIFAFLDGSKAGRPHFVGNMFYGARRAWQPGPADQHEKFLEMTERFADLEEAILGDGPRDLSREFFREVVALADLASAGGKNHRANAKSDEEIRSVSVLMRVLQLMENVWLAGDFERYWSHPLNAGWMSYFNRWASTPSLRRWWPILAPVYGEEFREFAAEQLGLDTFSEDTSPKIGAQLSLSPSVDPDAFESSTLWQQYLQRNPGRKLTGKVVHRLDLSLVGEDGTLDGRSLPVGFALVRELRASDDNHRYAIWESKELFIPPWLHGSGITGKLLDAVIEHYRGDAPRSEACRTVWVKFETQEHDPPAPSGKRPQPAGARPQALGPAARYLLVRDIEFYKSRGFRYDRADWENEGEMSLVLDL